MNNVEYYGQFQEDLWVLKELNYKKDGFFIDIGAMDGVKNSNTFLLEKNFNWNGICVEPNPLLRSFVSLQKNRKCCCVNAAIFNIDGFIDFQARGRHSGQSGIIFEDASSEIKRQHDKKHPTIKVKSMLLKTLLDTYNCPKIIDFLSLDTEGSEFEILNCFNFTEYTFKIIIVEHNLGVKNEDYNKCKDKKDNIKKLLSKNGYILKYSNQYDDYYII